MWIDLTDVYLLVRVLVDLYRSQLPQCHFEFLPVSPCTRCFGDNSKGVDGAADLLEVLGKATTLETLDFRSCDQIPAAVWQRVPSGAWPKLKPSNAHGVPEEELQRIRGDRRQGWAHAETSGFSCRFVRHWSVAEKECR